MKKYIQLVNKIQNLKRNYLVILFIFSSTLLIGQSITPTKIVSQNENSCGIIDVELNIVGANPMSKPLEVVLIIDASGSMTSGSPESSMDHAKDAAIDFINNIFLPINNPTGLNKVAIVSYATTATLRQVLTPASGKDGLISVVNGLVANGYTNLQDGIVKADNELTAHGTFNCNTSRSIILLTDGVSNRTGANGANCSSGTTGSCIQNAITAATNAKTTVVSGTTFNNQIFTVGLFGGISGNDQIEAQYCLDNIQSGGAFFTENTANLTGIYSQILNQISWVIAQITGTPFDTETISNNFDIVPGSISVTKGSFTLTGQIIAWNIDFLNNETITLKYQLTPKLNVCGDNIVSSSRLDYLNSECTSAFQNVITPNYCVPCAPILSSLPETSTINCSSTPNFITPIIENGCLSTSLTYVDDTIPGNCLGEYTIIRTWTASNSCYLATTSQTINVQDVTPPVIAPLPLISTINCRETPNFATAIATDDCTDNVTLTFTDEIIEGNCGLNYSVTRTWIAEDNCNNTSTASQTINVEATTSPVFTTQATNLEVECDGNGNITALNTWLASNAGAVASGSCSTVTWSNDFNSLSTNCGASGSVIVIFTATDECGNTANSTATFTIIDTNAPIFISNLPENISVSCGQIPNPEIITASDNCDNDVSIEVIDVINREDSNCEGSYIISRTWTITDDCNNSSSHTQIITVFDTTPPILTTPFNTVVNIICSEIPTKPELIFTDNCSGIQEIAYNENTTIISIYEYVIIREWIVSDNCGNEANFTQTLNVSIEEPFDAVIYSVCVGEGPINLFTILGNSIPTTGQWYEVTNSGGLSGTIFDPTNVNLGYYTLRYVVDLQDNTCPKIYEIYLNVNDDCLVLAACDITIYNAVSPNADNSNDFFFIDGIDCYPNNWVEIYNRWGVLVYDASGYDNALNSFKGISEGKNTINRNELLPDGTYFYILKYTDTENKNHDRTGYLYLNR